MTTIEELNTKLALQLKKSDEALRQAITSYEQLSLLIEPNKDLIDAAHKMIYDGRMTMAETGEIFIRTVKDANGEFKMYLVGKRNLDKVKHN